MQQFFVYTLVIVLCICGYYTLPMSTDPLRLQSQCVYCNNRMFAPTVRQCTGNQYLPANLAVEEAFCMVRNCRRQMPMMRPEPYYGSNIQPSINNINNINNVNTVNNNDDDYSDSEALYAENSASTPVKKRPAAPISVGRPQRPQRPFMRPFLFG